MTGERERVGHARFDAEVLRRVASEHAEVSDATIRELRLRRARIERLSGRVRFFMVATAVLALAVVALSLYIATLG
jgi:type VI protein secretion system component VasF